MQPFEYIILFFLGCLAYGIYRAIQDVRQEAKQEALKAYYDAMREAISKMTGLSKAFLGVARSAECANESIKCFSIIIGIDCPGGMAKDGKELHGYLSKDCIS